MLLTEKKIKKFFKKRKTTSHKGQNGRVLVIAGSEKLPGAAALCAISSLATVRSGVDLCTIAAPEKAGWLIHTYSPDLIVRKMNGSAFSPKHLRETLKLEKEADATIMGPGMGREEKTLQFIRKFVQRANGKIVLDADALAACRRMKFKHGALITPHAEEFRIFTGIKIEGKNLGDKIKIVKKAARAYNCTILLKGKIDIISDGKEVLLNKTGNAAMTVGGTGDILAGLCTGFIALGAGMKEAAGAAAFVNGKIGEELFGKLGYGLAASDFLEKIPQWTKRLLK